ncbi:MAG: carbohydrate ABC transporter permease, partial [Canibacter sp.]
MRVSRFERTVTAVLLVFFAVQALIPIVYVLFLSLSASNIGDPSWGHFENYAAAWEQGNFSLYMRNSVVIAVLVVSAALVLSVMSGYVLGILRP